MTMKEKDITGGKYGMLTAISFKEYKQTSYKKYAIWNFICECGNEVSRIKDYVTRSSGINGKRPPHCGCIDYKKEFLSFRLPYGEAAFNSLIHGYIKGAKIRDYSFELEKEDFRKITKMNCHYCGIEPATEYNRKDCNGPYVYNGVDRKDNSIGYTLENSLPCCWFCNRAKGNMNYDDFMNNLVRVSNYINKEDYNS